jgi:hypothetical protein
MRGPYELAQDLGIEIAAAVDLPFRVGSDDQRVIYCWDPARAVREDRIWEGIAQCVLTRIGVRWSERLAKGLAKTLRADPGAQKAS